MHHFTPGAILEEEIFIPRNLDWECDRIGQLLFGYGEKFIEPALKDGMYSLAVKWYLQMLDSLTFHYIQDEHWTYYDDLYFPDQAVHYIWEQFFLHIRMGKLTEEYLKALEEGLALIEQTEAYQNYGIPSGIPFKNLIGNVIPIFGNEDALERMLWPVGKLKTERKNELNYPVVRAIKNVNENESEYP